MMEDIALNGEYFDNDFFAYREDADLAWRAQLYGWRCLYTPKAIAYHVRHVLPEKRSALPALINMHRSKTAGSCVSRTSPQICTPAIS